jgi:hypothetical protein
VKIQSLTTSDESAVILDSLALASESRAALYVELGVRKAGTYTKVRRVLESTNARVHLLGVDCDPAAQRHWGRMLKTHVPRPHSRVTCSFELLTTQHAAAKDRAGPCAWVFVDACHCYECATTDIEQWGGKIAPLGVLVVHDTTSRRKNYTKLFQHNRTRPFGVYRAVEESEADGFLSRGWRKVWEVADDMNGVRVYQREQEIT